MTGRHSAKKSDTHCKLLLGSNLIYFLS